LNTNSNLPHFRSFGSGHDIPGPIRKPGARTSFISNAGGFTLVEAIIATLVLGLVSVSILSGLVLAYRTAANTRYRDHARYVLKSIGDQFLTRQAENAGVFNPLFKVTTGPTGEGLVWQGLVGTSANAASGLKVTLGETTGALITDALVTREVRLLNSTGDVDSVGIASSAGILLRGKFKITYTFNNVPYEQTLSLVRRVP